MINGIKKECKHETIVYTTTEFGNIVNKKYYNESGNLKREIEQDVRDKMLMRRRARDVQDFFLNMVKCFEYTIIK